MHSNFITPPDFVKSVLIVNATKEQLEEVANWVQGGNTAYNIYLYDSRMENDYWLTQVSHMVGVVLEAEGSHLLPEASVEFGPNCLYKNPVDFFAK